MNYYLGVVLIFFVVLGYVFFLKDRFNYNFGKSVFFSLSVIMFLMSLSSFLNQLLIGYYVVTFLGIIYLFYSLFKTIKNKDKTILNYFNNPSFVIFVIFYFFFAFVTRKINVLMGWDECSYWATMVKRLFYYNSYIGGNNFHSMYYPPALTSFNYYLVKFVGFTDGALYFSQYVFVLAGLVYLIKDYNWKKILWALLIVFSGFMLLILLLKPYVLTLYSEIPLILLSGIALVTLFTAQNKSDYYFVALLLCNTTWVKSNGLILCSLVVCLSLLQLFNFYKENLNTIKLKKCKKYLQVFLNTLKEKKELLIVVISPFLASFIFKIFLKVFHISNPQVASASLKSFIYTLLRDSENSNIVINFANALNKNYNFSTFNLTSILLVSLAVIGFLFINRIMEKKDIIKNNKGIFIAIVLSFIMYAASLLYAYCFLFSRGEANILASFDRYMNSFIGCLGVGLLGIIAYFIANNYKNDYLKKVGLVVYLGIICITNLGDAGSIFKQLLPKTQTTTSVEIVKGKELASKYKQYISDNDKVGFIIQGDYGLTIWASIYYMTPLKLYDPRFDGDIWSIRTKDSSDVTNTVEMSPENYIEKLKSEQITCLIVENINESFKKSYGKLFENADIINGLYKIDYNKNKFILVNTEVTN